MPTALRAQPRRVPVRDERTIKPPRGHRTRHPRQLGRVRHRRFRLSPGTGPGPAGFGSGPLSGQSMAAGVSGSERKPEYVQPASQAQVSPYSAYQTTPTPQANYTGPAGLPNAPQTWAPQVAPTYAAPSFNPGIIRAKQRSSQLQAMQQAAESQVGSKSSARDSVSKPDFSNESLEVLEHFGAEALPCLTSMLVLLKML